MRDILKPIKHGCAKFNNLFDGGNHTDEKREIYVDNSNDGDRHINGGKDISNNKVLM